jgi:nucleoside triphosphate pyrophosphatase
MKRFILASSSPARKEILEQANIKFIVQKSDYIEDMTLNLSPKDLAIFLSRGKAEDVATKHKNAVVLAADSFALYKGQLLGKPHTIERARDMLSMLSGNKHTFITGFTIIDCDSGNISSATEETTVFMKSLSDEEINGYLNKEDVLQNAGAYRIQNLGGGLIERIEGDYNNVRGLPLCSVISKLQEFGINLFID